MAYSIIPPILVVVSIIGIILFLIKKAPQVALIDERRAEENPTANSESERKSENGKSEKMKQVFLIILEKITRRFRLIFIKLDNLFTGWNNSIRKRRQERREQISNEVKNQEPADTVDKVRNYGFRNKRAGEINRNIAVSSPEEEREYKPMISEKVVSPRSKVELKDRLEKILIDRIAVNPKDIEAYERLGEYYLEIENLRYAKECFKQVIKLDPTNQSAKSKMRRLERLLGR